MLATLGVPLIKFTADLAFFALNNCSMFRESLSQCILGAAPGAMGLGLARGLVCPLLDIVNSAVTELGNALPLGFLFRAITRITQGLTDNILGSVVSCKPLLWRHP